MALFNSPIWPLQKVFGMACWRSSWSAICKDPLGCSLRSESYNFIWSCVPNRKNMWTKGCNQEWPTCHHFQWPTGILWASCPWNSGLFRVKILLNHKLGLLLGHFELPRDQQASRTVTTLAWVVDLGQQEELELTLHNGGRREHANPGDPPGCLLVPPWSTVIVKGRAATGLDKGVFASA